MPRIVHPMLVLIALASAALPAAAQDLEETLSDVGEQYARGYVAPLVHAWGANQNSALYESAAIPMDQLTFSFGVKAMATRLAEEDQRFRTVLAGVALEDYLPSGHPFAGADGDVVMEGPTAFGDEDELGTLTAYADGVPVYRTTTIEGLLDTRWVPLATPQFEVGGLYGLRATLRWLPEIDLGDYGKTKYVGYGLAFSPNALLPDLPVDVMVGFFTQQLDVGTIVENDATSVYLAASRPFGPAVVYAGVAAESSSMDFSYTYEEPGEDPVDVDFGMDGEMDNRFTLGATLQFPVRLNAELNVGTMTVLSTGLMFGF